MVESEQQAGQFLRAALSQQPLVLRARRAAASFSRSALLACAALVTALPAPASAGSVAGAGRWPHLSEIREVLAEPGDREARESLVELGPSAAPTIWAVLSGQVLAEEDFDREAGQELLRQTLADWPGRRTSKGLLGALRDDTPFAERLVLIELIGSTRCERALADMLEVLAGLDPALLRSRRISSSLKNALAPLLLEDSRRFHVLIELLPELPSELLPVLIEVVGDLPRPEAMYVLSRAAALGPGLERVVLGEIAGNGRRLAPGATMESIEFARQYVDSFDPLLRRLAAMALGRLRDGDSFLDLIRRLEDEDPVVRRVSLEALQELSGMRRPWTAERWRAFWESERAWLDGASELRRDLARGQEHEAGEAVRFLSRHRTFAFEVSGILAHGLENSRSRVRALTCEALSRLSHPAAVPHLIPALADEDDAVRSAARRALKHLTGVDLGEAWRDWDDWWQRLQ